MYIKNKRNNAKQNEREINLKTKVIKTKTKLIWKRKWMYFLFTEMFFGQKAHLDQR